VVENGNGSGESLEPELTSRKSFGKEENEGKKPRGFQTLEKTKCRSHKNK